MPEGVEVRIMSEELCKRIQNKSLELIEVCSGRYTKKDIGNSDKIKFPCKVKNVASKGKFMYWELEKSSDESWNLAFTFGLSGKFRIVNDDNEKFTPRVLFHLDNLKIAYIDPMGYGTIKFMQTNELQKKLRGIGMDVKDLTKEIFDANMTKMSKKNPNICQFLMDQSKISGIGNYLKCEILYDAKISPFININDLTDKQKCQLVKSIRKIYNNSYKARGSPKYGSIDGNPGKFEMKVYQKKLPNILVKETPDKRKTYYDSVIQI